MHHDGHAARLQGPRERLEAEVVAQDELRVGEDETAARESSQIELAPERSSMSAEPAFELAQPSERTPHDR